MVVTVYFSLISIMSIGMNSLTELDIIYMGSIIFSVILLLFYTIYILIWVRPFRIFELYKINNFFRVIGLIVLPSSKYGGIIIIDIAEIIFFIIDIALYRHEKINLKTYVL